MRPSSLSAAGLAAAMLSLTSLLASPAGAEGFGGLSATGLTFDQDGQIAIVSKDLFIGWGKISVDDVFKNTSTAEVTGEMALPLPPIPLSAVFDGMMHLPAAPVPDNLLGFSATVDGQPVDFSIETIAVIEPPRGDDYLTEAYDTPGQDITADLAAFGIPLTLETKAVADALARQNAEARTALEARGIASYAFEDAGTPQWSIVYRYHWTQSFPAGAEVRISHSYDNYPPGGLIYVSDLAGTREPGTLEDIYCIDAGTGRAIRELITYTDEDGAEMGFGSAFFTSYLMGRASNWAGPIGSFRLTLDKDGEYNILSLCMDGVQKTGPTTFVVERMDYTPEPVLDILLIVEP